MSINDTHIVTYEDAEAGSARQYLTFGASERDRRAEDTITEASDCLGTFVSGYDAASIVLTAEEVGRIQHEMDLADGIEPDPDWGRAGEAWLRQAALRPSKAMLKAKAEDSRFDIPNVGIDAVPVQTWQDASESTNALADQLGGYDFCPMIGWSEADGANSTVGRALAARGEHDKAAKLIAFAQVWLPQSARVKPARRWNGRIIEPSVEGSLFAVKPLRASQPWLPAASMRGIVKVYETDSDLESDIVAVRAELSRLRAAQRATAHIDDIVAEPQEPRRFRK
jgi:hypothetical protein